MKYIMLDEAAYTINATSKEKGFWDDDDKLIKWFKYLDNYILSESRGSK